MWMLYLLSFASTLLVVLFGIICIAAGIFFIAESVEENTVAARGVLYNAVTVCTVLNVLVGLTEDIPWTVTLTALAAHATYRHTLRAFPVLEIDGTFILGCVLLLAHNVLAFDVFVSTWYPFDEFLAYFVICVWLVPFGLFVSLSVNDNVLPTFGAADGDANIGVGSTRNAGNRAGILVVLDSAREYFGLLADNILASM